MACRVQVSGSCPWHCVACTSEAGTLNQSQQQGSYSHQGHQSGSWPHAPTGQQQRGSHSQREASERQLPPLAARREAAASADPVASSVAALPYFEGRVGRMPRAAGTSTLLYNFLRPCRCHLWMRRCKGGQPHACAQPSHLHTCAGATLTSCLQP
jgi:hypothetical protein